MATCDFLLVIHSNYGSISYGFRDKRKLRTKITNFPTHDYLTSSNTSANSVVE